MRLVTSTVLALSFVVFPLSTPASAAPVKKATTAKSQATAAAGAVKQVVAVPKHRTRAAEIRVARASVPRVRQEVADLRQDPSEVRMAAINVRQITQSTVAPSPVVGTLMPKLFASSDPVEEARRWIGTNPTDMNRLWCARFMNFVLERSGFAGTGSDAAKSFASYGRRVSGPRVGAIAVMTRGKNGGHVGIVSGVDGNGNPIVISGNHGKHVGEGVYPRSRVLAYVMPR